MINARDATIHDLHESNSWRITAPLRALSRRARWTLMNLRRASKLIFWLGTGQFSRTRNSIRYVISRSRAKASSPEKARSNDEDPQIAGRDALSELIRECREKNDRRTQVIAPERSTNAKAKTKISVIAWDLGHNPLGRAYLLADVLRNHYDVELIGANFPRFGNEIWGPLRDCSRVNMKSFPGGNFPEHFKRMEDIAAQIDGDVIYVSKPRLPSLELAILAKLRRNRPIILDIDDYELSFFNNHEPLTLDDLRSTGRTLDFDCPHDEVWTRYSESLVPLFDQITVSNHELQKKFGGDILPHIRNELDLEQSVYPRDEVRARLGFGPDDKVILFAGTLRIHKGVAQIVAALKKLHRPDYKLLIIGSPADEDARHFVNRVDPAYVKVIPDVPFHDLPGYLCAGDLICLLQDQDNVTSLFQIPAKLTDALAMGIPVLANNTPPLMKFASEGLVELLHHEPLDRKIESVFSNYQIYRSRAIQNRDVFLAKYSYGASRPKLMNMISRLLNNPSPIPDSFRELVEYHRNIFSDVTALPPTTTRVVTASQPAATLPSATPMTTAQTTTDRRAPKARPYADDKMDIVFFWKQNDTGIYGRRQDMLVKYLSRDSRVHRILHFDAPINLFRSGRRAITSGQGGRHSHARLIFNQTLSRKLRLGDVEGIRFDTFIFLTKRRVPGFLKWLFPSERGYLDYLDRVLRRYNIGERRTIFWVCPNNFYFPSIEYRFKADLVVADVIDDQRKWKVSDRHKEELRRNYQEVLALSHLVFVNCQSVAESMREFTGDIHILPNAAELLETDARHWKIPAEMKRIRGPVIGYVGNLDITRIDLELLTAIATDRPDWNLVFIGSMHMGKEIEKLDRFRNVHFLGVRVYDQAVRYIRHFDVAMIPHLDNDLTRHMNPLKLYVYLSLHVPVVSTPIANISHFKEFVRIGGTPEEFIQQIAHCLTKNPISGKQERLRVLLKANSWEERVARVLELVDCEFSSQTDEASPTSAVSTPAAEDGYTDRCTVCGHTGYLRRQETIASIRENYRCTACKASLRYREQARLILRHFAREGSEHLAALVSESKFQALQIYEPGLIGPFRKILQVLPGYRTSYFWDDVMLGKYRDGVQCQDLMNLTFEDDSFDLVLSSDIFEHVRKPFVGFKEVNRVLKPGGFHIFSIPSQHPMPAKTIFRVDTSGAEEVFVLPAHYHSAPMGGRSLVYTDFGADMVEIMAADDMALKIEIPCSVRPPAYVTGRMLTFYWEKQGPQQSCQRIYAPKTD